LQRLGNGYEFPKTKKGGTAVSAFKGFAAAFSVLAYAAAARRKVHPTR
jgi:hypothetical protein